uniref:Amino acid transporter n=1 Tax=Strigamia maritima TaxID=126957 RepID=T1JEB4_STRMM
MKKVFSLIINEAEKDDKMNNDEDYTTNGLALKLRKDSLSMIASNKRHVNNKKFKNKSCTIDRRSHLPAQNQYAENQNLHENQYFLFQINYSTVSMPTLRQNCQLKKVNWKFVKPKALKINFHQWMKKNQEFLITLISMFVAIIIGLVLHAWKIKLNPLDLYLITFPGKFYMRIMTCLLLPLISTSIISSIGKIEFSMEKKLIRHFLFFVVISTALAIGLSILVMYLMTPGLGYVTKKSSKIELPVVRKSVLDTFSDVALNMISQNGFRIFLNSTETNFVYVGPDLNVDSEQQKNLLAQPDNWSLHKASSGYINYLGIVTSSTIIGFILLAYKQQNEDLIAIIDCLERAFMIVANWFAWYAPIGNFFLFLDVILQLDHLHIDILRKELLQYVLSYFLTIVIHMFISIPFFICLITRINPWQFVKENASFAVLYSSFVTSSSIVTIPTTVRWLEKEMNIGSVETRLFVPLGAVISKNGSAIWFTITTIFISQALQVKLNFWTLVTICANSVGEIVNESPVPYSKAQLSGILDLLLPLGLEIEEFSALAISLNLVDRFLDRFRTAVNVYADLAGLMAVQQIKTQSILNEDDLLTWEEIIEQQDEAKRISNLQTEYVALHQVQRHSQDEDDLRVTSVTSLDISHLL